MPDILSYLVMPIAAGIVVNAVSYFASNYKIVKR